MGSGEGKEHPQHDAIQALFSGLTIPRPADWLIGEDGNTPNQAAMAAALRLGWERRFGTSQGLGVAVSQATRVLQAQEKYGHQAVGSGGGAIEQGAPTPHDELWATPCHFILHEALQIPNPGELLTLAQRWLLRDFALSAPFASPDGIVVMPCTRAKFQPPFWGVRSQCSRLMTKRLLLDSPFLKHGLAIEILAAVLRMRPILLEQPSQAPPNLAVPIKVWKLADGYVAALDHLLPGMNDPCPWVVADGKGSLLRYAKRWDDPFPAGLVAGIAPIGVGGAISASPASPAPSQGPISPPGPTPQPTPSSPGSGPPAPTPTGKGCLFSLIPWSWL